MIFSVIKLRAQRIEEKSVYDDNKSDKVNKLS